MDFLKFWVNLFWEGGVEEEEGIEGGRGRRGRREMFVCWIFRLLSGRKLKFVIFFFRVVRKRIALMGCGREGVGCKWYGVNGEGEERVGGVAIYILGIGVVWYWELFVLMSFVYDIEEIFFVGYIEREFSLFIFRDKTRD